MALDVGRVVPYLEWDAPLYLKLHILLETLRVGIRLLYFTFCLNLR